MRRQFVGVCHDNQQRFRSFAQCSAANFDHLGKLVSHVLFSRTLAGKRSITDRAYLETLGETHEVSGDQILLFLILAQDVYVSDPFRQVPILGRSSLTAAVSRLDHLGMLS